MNMLDVFDRYKTLTPTELVEALKLDMQNDLFKKIALATFSDTKYRLSPEQLLKFAESKKAVRPPEGYPLLLLLGWAGWQVLDAMGSGDLTGDAAKQALFEVWLPLPDDDREVVLMILDKTWRNGVTQDKINLAVPGTFRPAKFMLAHNVRDKDNKLSKHAKFPMLGTFKYDGFRGIFCHDTERCMSRNGNPYPLNPVLASQLVYLGIELNARYPDLGYTPAIDGELFAGSWKASAEARAVGYQAMVVFGMLPSEMIYGGTSVAFDVVEFLDTVDELTATYQFDTLTTPTRRILHNEQEMEAFYQEALAAGFEGLVLTSLVRPYEGKRSNHWLKRKPADPIDVQITDVILGTPRSKNEGKVVGLQVIYQGKVSGVSGMKQELIDKCTGLHELGELVGLTAEVVIHELTPDGFLRHGRVKTIRFDK